MTIRQLRDLLEQYDEDTEVRLMSQPSWPFEHEFIGVWDPSQSQPSDPPPEWDNVEDGEWDDPDAFQPASAEKAVYIVEGEQLAYGSKLAWEEAER